MTTLQALLGYLGLLLLAAVAVGLIARRRAALCWTFFAYLIWGTTSGFLVVRWPARFWEFTFYSANQTVYFVLQALVATQIWRRTFAILPRARIRIGLALTVALAGIAVTVATLPTDRHPYDIAVAVLAPRQRAGNLALFTIIVAAAWWYRVPLHPIYRAILGGFAVYLTVSTLTASVLGWLIIPNWLLDVVSYLNAGTYVLVTVWWAWAAWQPERVARPIVSTLQPWAHSW